MSGPLIVRRAHPIDCSDTRFLKHTSDHWRVFYVWCPGIANVCTPIRPLLSYRRDMFRNAQTRTAGASAQSQR